MFQLQIYISTHSAGMCAHVSDGYYLLPRTFFEHINPVISGILSRMGADYDDIDTETYLASLLADRPGSDNNGSDSSSGSENDGSTRPEDTDPHLASMIMAIPDSSMVDSFNYQRKIDTMNIKVSTHMLIFADTYELEMRACA